VLSDRAGLLAPGVDSGVRLPCVLASGIVHPDSRLQWRDRVGSCPTSLLSFGDNRRHPVPWFFLASVDSRCKRGSLPNISGMSR
jgi:hypothetical protein